jgi:hypothetical protein
VRTLATALATGIVLSLGVALAARASPAPLGVTLAARASPSPFGFARVTRASFAPQAAAEDAGTPRVSLICEKVRAPGRVRCEVEARVDAGESIAWGDVALVRVPPFAVALRGRVGPHDAQVREPTLWRWTFAIVAQGKGSGEIAGRVRVVVCRAAACEPREADVSGRVDVVP